MAEVVTYKPDRVGTGELMRTVEMRAMLAAKAETAKTIAEILSPDAPPIGVGYRSSFGIASDTERLAGTDRAVAILYNDSDHAGAVEWGWDLEHNQWANKPGYHVLARTADLIAE